jgi:hypothetical protein
LRPPAAPCPSRAGAAAGISRRHRPGVPGRCRGAAFWALSWESACASCVCVNHSLHRISDSCVLAGQAGPGQCNWQTIAGSASRQVHPCDDQGTG